MKKLMSLAAILVTSTVIADPSVIYGDDNRVDVYASTDSSFVELAKSTAAMIPKREIKKKFLRNSYKIKGNDTLEESQGVCSSERFKDQPTSANCSGFLVGDKYIVTAGHCIENMRDCKKNLWVFDYKMNNENEANLDHTKDTVYKCKSIVAQELNSSTKNDYALIELDRPVTGRRPVKFRKQGKPELGDSLVVIGHPSGLPTKISDGAQVKSLHGNYFKSNLDTYGGNSGSAVFNTQTGEVEGILVRGARDYVYSSGCRVSNRISDDVKGEGVTYITNIKELNSL